MIDTLSSTLFGSGGGEPRTSSQHSVGIITEPPLPYSSLQAEVCEFSFWTGVAASWGIDWYRWNILVLQQAVYLLVTYYRPGNATSEPLLETQGEQAEEVLLWDRGSDDGVK